MSRITLIISSFLAAAMLLFVPSSDTEVLHTDPVDTNTVNAYGQSYPTEISPWIFPNEQYVDHETGDINDDGTLDILLVKEEIQNDSKRRMLVILERQTNGKLKRASINKNLILCSTCGGALGDPYTGISIDKNKFYVHQAGGSNRRWDTTHAFLYQNGSWWLDSIEKSVHWINSETKKDDSIQTIKPPKTSFENTRYDENDDAPKRVAK